MKGVAEMEDVFAMNPAIALKDLIEAVGADETLRRRVLIIESESLPGKLEGLKLATPLIGETSSTTKGEWHAIRG